MKASQIFIPLVKRLADPQNDQGANQNGHQQDQKLADFERDHLVGGEHLGDLKLGLPFSPMQQPPAFQPGDEDHERQKVGRQDEGISAARLRNFFPSRPGSKIRKNTLIIRRQGFITFRPNDNKIRFCLPQCRGLKLAP